MPNRPRNPQLFIEAISHSGLSIYDSIEIGDPNLWIPTLELEILLDKGLRGFSTAGLANRTRSKVVKEQVCRILGYPVPSSFKRTKPRFSGQCFDTCVQKSNNLQVWNEELASTRRYVLVRVSGNGVVERVKVVTGDTLAFIDTTGILTRKFQARLIPGVAATELVIAEDTERIKPSVSEKAQSKIVSASPTDHPAAGVLLPIKMIYELLSKLIGQGFPDSGYDQERNRGAKLHRLVCKTIGYADYKDDGSFPDVRHQLLEVKLQTFPTIDLGLVCPNSEEALDVPNIQGRQIRHCDVRYALFYARTDGHRVTLTNFYLTTGAAFFSRFPQFQGKVLNKKLHISLSADFFSR